MALRPRTVIALVVVGLVAVSAAALVSARPRLTEAEDTADGRWDALRPILNERYDALAAVVTPVRRDKGELDLLEEVDDALSQWRVEAVQRRGADYDAEPAAANVVEGMAARLRRFVAASASLSGNAEINDALGAFDAALPVDLLEGYNRAVRNYDRVRNRFPGRFFAGLLGFESRRTVDIPG